MTSCVWHTLSRMGFRGTIALCLLTGTTGCGARTGLEDRDAGVLPPECVTNAQCDDGVFCNGAETCMEGHCLPGAPIVCMSGDPCIAGVCAEAARMCQYNPVTPDADMDGYRAPRPGFAPGAPGSCGNDCNDHDPNVHPGAREICNGIDDNCNGLIDEGAQWLPTGNDVRISEPADAPSAPGGLGFSGETYLASFWGYDASKSHVYTDVLDRTGTRVGTPPQQRVTQPPADAFGAAVVWNGTVYGIAWQDRRDPDGGYEIYFNRLTPAGDKLGPDQRITFARGFSINPTIAWTGSEFVIAWQDERDEIDSGSYEIYVQRLDGDGRLILPNQRMTHDPADSESPAIAAGDAGLGIAWMDRRGGGGRAVWFMALTRGLEHLAPDQRISPADQSAIAPTLVWNRDRWVMAWYDDGDASPDHEIWGAVRDAGGLQRVAPVRLSMDPNFSRYPSLYPLGDRLVVVWADDRIGQQYKLFTRMVSADLVPMTAETAITSAAGASVYPTLSNGPHGDIGVLFRDQREGRIQTYFTHLTCQIP